jgi:hypothetical protein
MPVLVRIALEMGPQGRLAWRCALPQKPVSSPTEKQLLSLLKATDRETGPAELSITWRVFIRGVELVGVR